MQLTSKAKDFEFDPGLGKYKVFKKLFKVMELFVFSSSKDLGLI